MKTKIIIIGGGAAGYMAAITAAENAPQAEVVLLEKANKTLAKVLVSGGGRCNVTHNCFSPAQLAKNYPRGSSFLKEAFRYFQAKNTVDWFQSRGVPLKTEADGRMFPVSDRSESIADCLTLAAQNAGVTVRLGAGVSDISPQKDGFKLTLLTGESLFAHRVLVATGGCPTAKGYDWLTALGHSVEPPVPSLFTFNIHDKELNALMGLAAPDAAVRIRGFDYVSRGPLLITHWGLSGPAALKASAFAARFLAEKNYEYEVVVQWAAGVKLHEIEDQIADYKETHPKKTLANLSLFDLPKRLWVYLLEKTGAESDSLWGQFPKKQANKLIETLMQTPFQARGKTTFKEEFVTAGGIKLSEVSVETMESKRVQGLYFAGEILDIDGVTGGFNFQAAWTTGFLAGKAMAASL